MLFFGAPAVIDRFHIVLRLLRVQIAIGLVVVGTQILNRQTHHFVHLVPGLLHLVGQCRVLAVNLRQFLPRFVIGFGFCQRVTCGAEQFIDRRKGCRIALIFQVADRHAGHGDACFHQRVHAVAQAFLLSVEHTGILEVMAIVTDGRVEQPSRDNLQQTEYGEGKDNTGNHVQIFQHSGRPLENMQGFFNTIVVENLNFNLTRA